MDDRLNDALLLTATVSVVAWTGGFLLRKKAGWQTKIAFQFAMNELQVAFVAPIILLLSSGEALRVIAMGFFGFYVVQAVLYLAIPKTRPIVLHTYGLKKYVFLHTVEYSPMLLVALWPTRVFGAWLSFVAMFLGYQVLLLYFYRNEV